VERQTDQGIYGIALLLYDVLLVDMMCEMCDIRRSAQSCNALWLKAQWHCHLLCRLLLTGMFHNGDLKLCYAVCNVMQTFVQSSLAA
jgi:hypothetical protein